MPRYYANVTLDGPDATDVATHLTSRGVVAYVAPAPKSKTVVFHEDLGAQEQTASQLSAHFRCPALLVMDYILGTGAGFTDRLSSRLRDREGLAYTVTANITSSASEEPGLFTCYIGTEAKNFARVKEGAYGLCEDCSHRIPAERLRYQPSATRCVECQGRWDRLNGRTA